jgi:Zn-dependent protease
VGFNWSLLVVFGLIVWSLADGVLPAEAPGQPGLTYWLVSLVVALLFFASILAHELAHSLVARREGQPVEGITLWLFGGVSKLGGDAGAPGVEARVAVVGPLTSFALAILFLGISIAVAPVLPPVVVGGLFWLAVINFMLGAFNLLPGFPLDGGRLLRALLWQREHDRARATARAAAVGRALGLVLMGVGVLELMFRGSVIGGLWMLFIGWFLRGAATAEETRVVMDDLLKDVRVRDVMSPAPVSVPPGMTVQEFLLTQPLQLRHTTFPLVYPDGSPAGLVRLQRILRVPEHERATTRMMDVADGLDTVPTARPDEYLTDVLSHIDAAGPGRILVVDRGQLVGIVSPRDIAVAVQVLGARRDPGTAAA